MSVTLALASTFVLLASSCLAEETADTTNALLQDFPVVLTASRLSQPQSEAPSAVTVIDHEMIKASGFRTVPDLMRLVPGMYVGFADANRPMVSFHGATDEFSRRMQVLIDGRSIYLPPFGTVSWADLPILIEDIERIEVVHGPSSASYGSNSFYGVINIITRDALSQNGASVSAADGDVSDVSARYGRVGEKLDFRFSVGSRSDRGINNDILNDHNETHLFNLRSNYHPNTTDSLDVQLGSSTGVYGIGIAGRAEDAFRETTSRSDFVQTSWLHIWPEGDESKLTYSQTQQSSFDPHLCFDSEICQGNRLPILPAQGFTQKAVHSQRNDVELQNTNQLNDSNRLVWGGVTRRDYADYPLFLGVPYTVNPWQVFAHDEWRVTEATVLNIGTMFEDDGMGNRSNSPRASLNYHLMPQHTVRIGISTATRSPAMGELFMDSQGTILGGAYVPPATPLTPEKITSKELGYLGDFQSLGVTLDARAYIDQVTDMIFTDLLPAYPLSNANSFKNMLTAEFKGVEATVKYFWNDHRSFMAFNYAYQEASVSLGNYPTQYFNPSIGATVRQLYQTELLDKFSQIVPTNSASLLLSQQLANDWKFSAGYYWREPVRAANVGANVPRENTMQRLDFRIAKSFRIDQGRSGDIALIMQNATQEKYTKYGTVDAMILVEYKPRLWLTGTLNF